MACSKLPPDVLDIKDHYSYHGGERCALVDTTFNNLYGMDYVGFANFLKDEIPQLFKLQTLRVCFQDDEGTYIDLKSKNYHRFLRLSTHAFKTDVPKINIKVLEGASPAVQKKKDADLDGHHVAKRNLFDKLEFSNKFSYRSPVEIEMDLKQKEIVSKEKEVNILFVKYDSKVREYNPNIYTDTSKTFCTKCHLRMGHTKNRCHMPECSSASICGQLDRHGNEKKEVQELGKRKLKAEVELKALKADLSVKQTLSKNVSQSFEARIHDALIRTNLGKCLTENNRPKEGVILAYTYILKKYYGGRIPDAASLELENEIFQTVIQSHEEKQLTTRSKNNVIKELENRGIKWPNVSHDTQQALQFTSGYPLNASPMFYNPAWYQQPANFPFGGYSVTPTRIDVTGRHPLASPAPPPQPPLPPLPDDLMPGSTTEVGNDSAE